MQRKVGIVDEEVLNIHLIQKEHMDPNIIDTFKITLRVMSIRMEVLIIHLILIFIRSLVLQDLKMRLSIIHIPLKNNEND